MSYIKTLKKPAKILQDSLKVVLLLVTGKEAKEWSEVLKIMAKSGFINQVLDLDMDKVKKKTINKIEKIVTDKDKWNVEKTTKAFKPAGLLAKWVES